jgi:hypothetical protein
LAALLSTALPEQHDAEMHMRWPNMRIEHQAFAEVLLGPVHVLDLYGQQGRPIVGLKMVRLDLSGLMIQFSRHRQLPIPSGVFR